MELNLKYCIVTLVYITWFMGAAIAEAQTTTRALTPTMAPDQTGCPTIHLYDVGVGKTYTALGQLPWSKFKGCDTVRIFAKPNSAPYNEMILASAGTDVTPTAPNQFMRIIGMPDPITGALPIVDGTNATQLETLPGQQTRSLQYWENLNPSRALYKLGLVTVSGQYGRAFNYGPPGYISIENLEIRNANYGEPFFDAQGGPTATAAIYDAFTACVNVEAGAHVLLKNNIIHNCGNGIFINSKNEALTELSQDILIESNKIYDNSIASGVGGSNGYAEHNSYTEARDIIFQYNYFGNVKPGAHGDCLKDRSSGLVVRYNIFESNCGIQLHLVDSTGGKGLIYNDPGYSSTYIYGNVFDISGQVSSLLTKYGGDSGITNHYRQGTLFFYNNTFSVKGDATSGPYATVYLFLLDAQPAVADARNNVFYTRPETAGGQGKVQAVTIGVGAVNLVNNWISPNAAPFWLGHVAPGAVVMGWNTNVGTDNSPGFANEDSHNFNPLAHSPLIDSGVNLDGQIEVTGNLPVGLAGGGLSALRPHDSVIDIGAFEYHFVDVIFFGGFELP